MPASPYFDATDTTHKALVPPALRTSAELAAVAAVAEADVISQYTRRYRDARYTVLQPVSTPGAGEVYNPTFVYTPRGYATDLGNGTYVYLTGYTLDAADATVDAGLKLALRREIADVIAWRLRQWQRDLSVASESDTSGLTRSYRSDAASPFPPAFGRWLKPFDSRPVTWAF